MRIVLTGGGTGGHFYPLIAIAEALEELSLQEEKDHLRLYYLSTEPYDTNLLLAHNITFKKIPAGKVRTHASKRNLFDPIKTLFGVFIAVFKVFLVYPDVVFAKGGYASFPTLFAARILGIPVVIHESDTIPGRVNIWAAKFARSIALSWSEALSFFPGGKAVVTGQPIRKALLLKEENGAYEAFSLEQGIPVLTILGGSQGAQRVNDYLLDIMPTLLERFQVIHQTGKDNYDDVSKRVRVLLERNDNKGRYHAFSFLDEGMMRKMAAITTLIISRSGSIIFELAEWGIPAILIPIPENISRDQTKNAYSYARAGAARVLEEENLTPHILIAEMEKIIQSPELYKEMKAKAIEFSTPDAALKIGREIMHIASSH